MYYGRCANVEWAPAFLDTSWRLRTTYWRQWIVCGFGNNEVAAVITWRDKECIDIFRTNVPINDYHTVKYRKIAHSLPEFFSKIIFRFTSQKFPLATSQCVEWRGGGDGGKWGTPTSIKVTWWVFVVSLGDRMTFYQRYHLRMLVEKYLHKKKTNTVELCWSMVSIRGQIKPQLRPTSSQGLFP